MVSVPQFQLCGKQWLHLDSVEKRYECLHYTLAHAEKLHLVVEACKRAMWWTATALCNFGWYGGPLVSCLHWWNFCWPVYDISSNGLGRCGFTCNLEIPLYSWHMVVCQIHCFHTKLTLPGSHCSLHSALKDPSMQRSRLDPTAESHSLNISTTSFYTWMHTLLHIVYLWWTTVAYTIWRVCWNVVPHGKSHSPNNCFCGLMRCTQGCETPLPPSVLSMSGQSHLLHTMAKESTQPGRWPLQRVLSRVC